MSRSLEELSGVSEAKGIYNDRMTIDVFLFNTTRRTLEITRGLEHTGRWQRFALTT